MDPIDLFYINQRQLYFSLGRNYPGINSIEEAIEYWILEDGNDASSLDLGCGANPRNPFNARYLFGVDIRADLGESVKRANLAIQDIPFGSNDFDFCTAYDFLEHVPRLSWPDGKPRNSFISLLNEIYRVLSPNGLFLHSTPTYPSKIAFQDPTHYNIMTEDTIPHYFCNPDLMAKKLGYGFEGCFEVLVHGWLHNSSIVSVLKAKK